MIGPNVRLSISSAYIGDAPCTGPYKSHTSECLAVRLDAGRMVLLHIGQTSLNILAEENWVISYRPFPF